MKKYAFLSLLVFFAFCTIHLFADVYWREKYYHVMRVVTNTYDRKADEHH